VVRDDEDKTKKQREKGIVSFSCDCRSCSICGTASATSTKGDNTMVSMEANTETGRPSAAPLPLAETTSNLFQEVWGSADFLFQNKLAWLLALGPIALIGDATGSLGEAACFALSGIALIPCAER
jgi:hypothetical protein